MFGASGLAQKRHLIPVARAAGMVSISHRVMPGRFALHGDSPSRHLQYNADMIPPALSMMPVRLFDDHVAGGDTVEKPFEFLDAPAHLPAMTGDGSMLRTMMRNGSCISPSAAGGENPGRTQAGTR
jgi:hypothetical protein